MAVITPNTIANRLGTVISSPAATNNVGPTTGDIGASGSTPTRAVLRRVFDVTLTSGGSGDTATFAIPAEMQKGMGLMVTVTPENATAVTGAPYMDQFSSPTAIVLHFTAAAAGAIYRVTFDAMHSIGR